MVSAQPLDHLDRNAGFLGRAGAGRNHDRVDALLGERIDGDFVIPVHLDRGPERTERVHQVPGEAVVVVDQGYMHGLDPGRVGATWCHRASSAPQVEEDGKGLIEQRDLGLRQLPKSLADLFVRNGQDLVDHDP